MVLIKFHYWVKNIYMNPTENYYSYKFTQIFNVAIKEEVINMKHLLLGNNKTVMEKLKARAADLLVLKKCYR